MKTLVKVAEVITMHMLDELLLLLLLPQKPAILCSSVVDRLFVR